MPNPNNVTAPILLIGPGRSGSSWMLETLAKHPDVQCVIETSILSTLQRELYESWWVESHIIRDCNEQSQEHDRKAAAAVRAFLYELFPSDQPRWFAKAIGYLPVDFMRKVFPDARYIHLIRSPLTALPSIVEYLGTVPMFSTIESSERHYIDAHRDALAMRDTGAPYLAIHQEEIQNNPVEVWQRFIEFTGLREIPLSVDELNREYNASRSMRGKAKSGRPPMFWSELSEETFELCRELGYQPPDDAPARATPSQLTYSMDEYAQQCDRLRVQMKRLEESLSTTKSRLEAMESSKFWKLRAAWFKLRHAVGIQGD
ncbi:sulfotransferase [Leptolyngbya sp. FACHB-261]|uniref:sulfotransferase family protein n=1 Tax=Leptolyngbya sp. FACHB-261 TaxID=2692806 RepID=UPI00168371B7|nr:sulfotransferase [Leptolyngbya sp. FACHB-261]MBD2103183.1 sulfotransferase [Leptolyngbya sp. FACHB-261]